MGKHSRAQFKRERRNHGYITFVSRDGREQGRYGLLIQCYYGTLTFTLPKQESQELMSVMIGSTALGQPSPLLEWYPPE